MMGVEMGDGGVWMVVGEEGGGGGVERGGAG